MKVVVSGSSGMIGSALVPLLETSGYEVVRLVRSKSGLGRGRIFWDPDSGKVDDSRLEGTGAVVHLAGANIAGARWTEKRKRKIRESRVLGTRVLCEALARLKDPPTVLVSASATGYYGNRGDEVLSEQSAPGSGFLSDVCVEWEAATQSARSRGIRVVHLRIGIVLSLGGGALAKMLLPFRLGLGGAVGDGRQYWSWIALDDLLHVILHCITEENLDGPVNCTAPFPVTNREFTKTLGRVLSRPTFCPLPAFVLRIMLGEMADALLLSSTRVEPRRLIETGYSFLFPDLEGALRHTVSHTG